MAASPYPMESDSDSGDCILWVDGSQGIVRAMDVVSPDSGHAAVVRALLRAMEHPHSPAAPGRPQKIVVKDREIQFFLRGILQDLDIVIDYVPDLPLIDEIFRGFQEVAYNKPPMLPPQYAQELTEKAFDLWLEAPWDILADRQIISIEINDWDVGNLYACVMGMLGLDYGVLFYRSLDSLKHFRQQVVDNDSPEQLQEAFLSQDCLFVTFESEMDDEDIDLASLPNDEVSPSFGNLHPLEGLRSVIYEEEALTIYVALEALHRFFKNSRRKLKDFPPLSSRYRIRLPQEAELDKQQVSVKVSTMPDVAEELYEMSLDAEDEDDDFADSLPMLRDDLIPPNSFVSLGVIPWERLDVLRSSVDYHESASVSNGGDGLPIILIQTTRPKAKTLIQELKDAGGMKGICFNPGEDPLEEESYDLGILQTKNEEMHLFGEFFNDDSVHVSARKKWDDRCKKTKGYCGLVIAMGLTGASRGNPQIKDMLALFEGRSLTSKDLGLGTLQRLPMPL